jgi:hypothetical protein
LSYAAAENERHWLNMKIVVVKANGFWKRVLRSVFKVKSEKE